MSGSSSGDLDMEDEVVIIKEVITVGDDIGNTPGDIFCKQLKNDTFHDQPSNLSLLQNSPPVPVNHTNYDVVYIDIAEQNTDGINAKEGFNLPKELSIKVDSEECDKPIDLRILNDIRNKGQNSMNVDVEEARTLLHHKSTQTRCMLVKDCAMQTENLVTANSPTNEPMREKMSQKFPIPSKYILVQQQNQTSPTQKLILMSSKKTVESQTEENVAKSFQAKMVTSSSSVVNTIPQFTATNTQTNPVSSQEKTVTISSASTPQKPDLKENILKHAQKSDDTSSETETEWCNNRKKLRRRSSKIKQEQKKFVPSPKYHASYGKKNYFYVCKLCDFRGERIVNHYVTGHPESDVLIARLEPSAARKAIESGLVLPSKYKKSKFYCRFCDWETVHINKFLDHTTSHTGEFRYQCGYSECSFKSTSESYQAQHFKNQHLADEDDEPKQLKVIVLKPNPTTKYILPGYLCAACNYVQLSQENVMKHISTYHPTADSEQILKKINFIKFMDRNNDRKPSLNNATVTSAICIEPQDTVISTPTAQACQTPSPSLQNTRSTNKITLDVQTSNATKTTEVNTIPLLPTLLQSDTQQSEKPVEVTVVNQNALINQGASTTGAKIQVAKTTASSNGSPGTIFYEIPKHTASQPAATNRNSAASVLPSSTAEKNCNVPSISNNFSQNMKIQLPKGSRLRIPHCNQKFQGVKRNQIANKHIQPNILKKHCLPPGCGPGQFLPIKKRVIDATTQDSNCGTNNPTIINSCSISEEVFNNAKKRIHQD